MEIFEIFIKLLISFNFLLTAEKLNDQVNSFSEIHLAVKGTGDIKILNDSFGIEPSEVKINKKLYIKMKLIKGFNYKREFNSKINI